MIKGITEDILKRVYDFSEMTNEELRCKFFQKLQECIELCNNTADIMNWIKNEGLEEEVNELLSVWKDDGTLDKIINIDLFNNLKTELVDKVNTNGDKINNNKNEIENLKSEKYIFIGDSYGEGYTPDGNVTSWIDYTKQLMNLSNENCYKYAVGGYGFTTSGFQELINRAVSEIQEKQQVKYIVVGGGYNDAWNYSAIATNMKMFFDTCKTNFPNAKVIIAPFGWCVEGLTTGVHVTQSFSNLIHMVLEYQRNAVLNGGCYIDGIYSVLHKNDFFSSDYVHPNNNGQYAIGLAVANYLMGKGFTTVEYMNNENVFNNNVYEPGVYVSCQCISTVENKNTILHLTSGKITGTFTDVKLDGHGILLGTVKNASVNGNYEKTVFPVKGILKTHDSHYYDIDFIMYISHNKLYMSLAKVNDTNDDFLTLSFIEINVPYYCTPITINSLIN